MPDFKCVACRLRVRTAVGGEAGPACPVCQAPLDHVADLSDLVGLRLIQPDGMPVDRRPAQRLADAVNEVRAADRWLDDSGSFDNEAVAAALEVPPAGGSVKGRP